MGSRLMKAIMRDGAGVAPGTLKRARAKITMGGTPESPGPDARTSRNSTVHKPWPDLREAVVGSMTWDEAADRVGCSRRMLLAIAAGERSPSPELRRAIRRELGV